MTDLVGKSCKLKDADGSLATGGEFASESDHFNAAELRFTTPAEVTSHPWALSSAPSEDREAVHGEITIEITAKLKPHGTSLAVWDVPSLLQPSERFRVKIGATCAVGCELAANEIEVNMAGHVVARRTFGSDPWPETDALYWTEIELTAPGETGRARWEAHLLVDKLKLPHGSASFNFGVEIVSKPEHVITVRVTEKETGTPLEGAMVWLGAYLATSDAKGIARVEIPKGDFELDVLKADYEIEPAWIRVVKDCLLRIEMRPVPKKAPDGYWYYKRGEGN